MRTFRNTPTRSVTAFGLVLALSACGALSSGQIAAETHDTGPPLTGALMRRQLGTLPLRFEANRGQTDFRVKFLSRGPGYTLFLTQAEAVVALDRARNGASDGASNSLSSDPPDPAGRDVLRMKLVNGRTDAAIEGVDALPGQIRYSRGSEPGPAQQEVDTYARVHYDGVYPGIDLVYYGNQGALEFDFEVAPGADPAAIRLAFEGATALNVGQNGALTIKTPGGHVQLQAPVLYQELDGIRAFVSGSYAVEADGTVIFQIGEYDARQALVIDPVLLYSSYLGGSGPDGGVDIALDAAGFIYVTGYTSSVDFPVADAAQPGRVGDDYDMFVTKLNPSGTSLVYTTYLGDTRNDQGLGIAVDAAGFAYVAGTYTVPPSWNQQVLVAKFDPKGTMVYATVFGGASPDLGYAIAIDAAGFAYVTGQSGSASDFPTTQSAIQPKWPGFQDAFVSVLDPTGTMLVYSTYLGGGYNDQGRAIALDSDGNVYVTGGTMGGFPTTPGAFQRSLGGFGDAFIVKIDPRLSGRASLIYSTLLGGLDFEVAHSIAVDAQDNVYVTGSTDSGLDFPTTPGAFQKYGGGGNCGTWDRPRDCQDAFLTKLNPSGSTLMYSTYLGGLGNDFGNGIAVDAEGFAYVVGQAFAHDFPVHRAVQSRKASGCCTDGFLTKFTPAGAVRYSTYFGGAGDDSLSDIALDGGDNAFIIGSGDSPDLVMVNPLQGIAPGATDAFIAVIGDPAVAQAGNETNKTIQP